MADCLAGCQPGRHRVGLVAIWWWFVGLFRYALCSRNAEGNAPWVTLAGRSAFRWASLFSSSPRGVWGHRIMFSSGLVLASDSIRVGAPIGRRVAFIGSRVGL